MVHCFDHRSKFNYSLTCGPQWNSLATPGFVVALPTFPLYFPSSHLLFLALSKTKATGCTLFLNPCLSFCNRKNLLSVCKPFLFFPILTNMVKIYSVNVPYWFVFRTPVLYQMSHIPAARDTREPQHCCSLCPHRQRDSITAKKHKWPQWWQHTRGQNSHGGVVHNVTSDHNVTLIFGLWLFFFPVCHTFSSSFWDFELFLLIGKLKYKTHSQ